MSATAQVAGAGRTPLLGRIVAATARVPMPISVLLAARLIVLGAACSSRSIRW